MRKKISYLLFILIGLFVFCSNTKADFNATGLISGLPSCSLSAFPTFLEEDTFYPCIFNWARDFGLNNVNHPAANPGLNSSLTIDDYPYIVSITTKSTFGSTYYDYYVYISKSLPIITTHNNVVSLEFTDSYFRYSRYWYRSNSRRADLTYRDSNSTYPVYYNFSTFTNNSTYDLMYSTSNINFDNINIIPNFPINNYTILPFSYGSIIYNPGYLDDNSSWTKHCLNPQNTFFSVLPNTIDITYHDLVDNYILFPQLLYDYGINWLQYNTINSSNLYENTYDLEGLYDYKFTSKDEMDRLSTDSYVQDFNSRYPGLYKNLYGWNMFLNRIQYTDDDKYNIQVFHFDNSYLESVSCLIAGDDSSCESGGGGGHSFDTVVDVPTRDICFYIPNTMYLKLWDINDYNDIDDTITLNGNDYDINTDSYQLGYNYNINNNTYSGYVGYFKSLINACKIPLDFIGSKITLFFNKLPSLVQYAIISGLFILIVIGLIKFLTGGK